MQEKIIILSIQNKSCHWHIRLYAISYTYSNILYNLLNVKCERVKNNLIPVKVNCVLPVDAAQQLWREKPIKSLSAN